MATVTLASATTPPVVGMLINPLSGKNRQGFAAILQTVGEHPDLLLHKVQTPQDVYDALLDFGRRKVNLLVISGGDGTIQAVLTVLLHHHPFATEPKLIVLEGGTTNMIAGDIGVSGNQDRALRRLLQWVHTGRGTVTCTQRSVLRLQVPGHDAKYGMFFGAACISQGVQYYQTKLHNNKLHGLPGICMTLARFLWASIGPHSQVAPPTPIQVCLDQQAPLKENFMLLLVSTLDRLFFGLRPFWGSESGCLRFTAIRSKARYLLRVLPFLARGRRVDKATQANGYYSHNVNEIELYTADSMALDGEIYTPDSSGQPTLLQYGGQVTFMQL